MPRFIASAWQVPYVGLLESALVAATTGTATQARSALVTANAAIRIMLLSRLGGFTSIVRMLVLQIPTLILVNRSPAPRAALLTAAIAAAAFPHHLHLKRPVTPFRST